MLRAFPLFVVFPQAETPLSNVYHLLKSKNPEN